MLSNHFWHGFVMGASLVFAIPQICHSEQSEEPLPSPR
jgi:hypothetical protein